jgi:hypothetical protein
VSPLATALRERLVPAVLTAAGVTLIAAGLLNYSGSVQAIPLDSPDPTEVAATPVGSLHLPTLPPLASNPAPSASPDGKQVATRVVVPALRIDIPVVPGPPNRVLCNVAMYASTKPFVQPGLPGSSYIYAHARVGMFLPLLTASQHNNGKALIGNLVEVYTSDDQQHVYVITAVRRHVPKTVAYNDPYTRTAETMWLQTSEGPKGTPTVLQVIAEPFTVGPAAHADAHPAAKPVVCA